MPNQPKPRAFIGSSVKGLDIARAIQEELRKECDCTVWNQGTFKPGKTPIEALTKALNEHDFAIFIFLPEDVVTLKGKTSETVRDNVLFELGLFIGKLGRNRNFFVVPEGEEQMHICTDLAGITPATYDPKNQKSQAAVSSACFHIREQIREVVAEAQAKEGELQKSLNEIKQEIQVRLGIALGGVVNKWEKDYLKLLAKDEPWKCRWDQDTFNRLKRLDELGFVLPTEIDGTRNFERFRERFQTDRPVDEREWFDMKKFWEITEDGKKYLESLGIPY